MRAIFFLVFVLCLCFTEFVLANSAKQIYSSLDEKDKKYFLQYLLGAGYEEVTRKSGSYEVKFSFPEDLNIPKNIINKFEVYRITPVNFAEEFYKNFKEKFNLTTTETLDWIMGEIICLPSGECIDTGDAGSICCT